MTREQRRRQLDLIWGAMLGSVAIYGLACALAVGTVDVGLHADAEPLRLALSAVAVVLGALSVWWRRHFLVADPVPPVPVGLAHIQNHAVVVWALSEAVAICGLLVAILVREAGEYLPFGAAAAALLLLHRPASLPWQRLEPPGSEQ